MVKQGRLMAFIGFAGMVALIAGVLSEPASLLQKSLFLSGSLVLTGVAHAIGHRTLFVLQAVIVLGSAIAFFELGPELKYAAMLGASAVAIAHLAREGVYSKDPWSVACSAGLVLIAAGFATDAMAHPKAFGISLGAGALLVALYSFVDFFWNRNRMAAIWLVLNVVFSVNPLMMAFGWNA